MQYSAEAEFEANFGTQLTMMPEPIGMMPAPEKANSHVSTAKTVLSNVMVYRRQKRVTSAPKMMQRVKACCKACPL